MFKLRRWLKSLNGARQNLQHQREGVVRLHGQDRQGVEKVTGKEWSKVVAPKDDDIATLAKMLPYMESRGVQTFTFVNNHFEGSTPKTVERILKGLYWHV